MNYTKEEIIDALHAMVRQVEGMWDSALEMGGVPSVALTLKPREDGQVLRLAVSVEYVETEEDEPEEEAEA